MKAKGQLARLSFASHASFHRVCLAIFLTISSASTDYHNGNSSVDFAIPGVTSSQETLEEIITRQSNAFRIVV